MANCILGTVTHKHNNRIFLDTNDSKQYDKVIICDKTNAFDNKYGFSYQDVYDILKAGDYVIFPTALSFEMIDTLKLIQCDNLTDEPVINTKPATDAILANHGKRFAAYKKQLTDSIKNIFKKK